MKTILSYLEMTQFKINLTFSLFIVVIFSIGCSEKTDKQEAQKNSLINENEKVNEAIMDKDWEELYEIKKKYWVAKNSYISSKDYFLRNHEEAFWVRWPVVRMISYQIDTLRQDQDSICIKATTKNYFEAYHLFMFWHRNKDTMLHNFEYFNKKWYLTDFGRSNLPKESIDYDTLTTEEIDSLGSIRLAPYLKSK